ncbi:MAG: hypothetical protein QNJ30_24215 [Kiloniellales bacterium]|nr:hypothetical protein [Kiloniellales bacterium]
MYSWLGGGQDLGLGTLLDDLSTEHDHDLVRDRLHRRQAVGDEHAGDLELVLQALQQLQNLLGDQLAEGRSHLVADDQLGLGGERAGDADALLLAAREIAGMAVDEVVGLQLDQAQQLADPLL